MFMNSTTVTRLHIYLVYRVLIQLCEYPCIDYLMIYLCKNKHLVYNLLNYVCVSNLSRRMHQHQMQIVEGGGQKTGVEYSYVFSKYAH